MYIVYTCVYMSNKRLSYLDSIRELSSNSAAGPDGIPPSLLFNCAHELVPSLVILFKQSLLSGVIDPSLQKLLLFLF